MTNEELIGLGEFSASLLGNENFTKLVKLYEQNTVLELLNTKPEEKERRDTLYSSFQGVRDFLGLMEASVATRDAILQADETAPSENTDAQ